MCAAQNLKGTVFVSFVSENESRYRFCPLSLEIGYDFQGRHEGARLNIRFFVRSTPNGWELRCEIREIRQSSSTFRRKVWRRVDLRNEILLSGLACVARGRRKKGMERGRQKSTKEGKGKGASPFPSLPYLPPFSSFSLSPYPFRHLLRRLWVDQRDPGVGCVPYMTHH